MCHFVLRLFCVIFSHCMSAVSYCRISFGCCGRFTLAELLSFSLSVMLVLIWVLTGHWLLMDGASLMTVTVSVSSARFFVHQGSVHIIKSLVVL